MRWYWQIGLVAALLVGDVCAQQERTRIEVPLFEGGAGLDFYDLVSRAYEDARPDVEVGYASSKAPFPR